jgi:hypothetical protein
MRLLDPDHPFFAAAWRRWATVIAPAAWAVLELAWGNPGWAVLFGGAALYALWILILEPRR